MLNIKRVTLSWIERLCKVRVLCQSWKKTVENLLQMIQKLLGVKSCITAHQTSVDLTTFKASSQTPFSKIDTYINFAQYLCSYQVQDVSNDVIKDCPVFGGRSERGTGFELI